MTLPPDTDRFDGIYDPPKAARYLLAGRMANELYPVSSRTIIRWIKNGLALPDLAELAGRDILLNFEDLVSLRVIAALRAYKVPWGNIYEAEDWLRAHTSHPRPFATEQLWTAQSQVFTALRDHLISATRHGQLAMDILKDYLIPISGLTFVDKIAHTWEPKPFIEINPLVQFGSSIIKGTRVPTRSIWGMIEAGDSYEMAMRAFEVSREEAIAAWEWEESVAKAA